MATIAATAQSELSRQIGAGVVTIIGYVFTGASHLVFHTTGFACAFLVQGGLQLLCGIGVRADCMFAAAAILCGTFLHGSPTWHRLATELMNDVRKPLGNRKVLYAAAATCTALLLTTLQPTRMPPTDDAMSYLCWFSSCLYAYSGGNWNLALAQYTAVYLYGRACGLAPGLLLVSGRMLLSVALLFLKSFFVVSSCLAVLAAAVCGAAFYVLHQLCSGAFWQSILSRAREGQRADGPPPESWSEFLGDGEWLGEGEQMTMPLGALNQHVGDLVCYHDGGAAGAFKLKAIAAGAYTSTRPDGTVAHYGVQCNFRLYSLDGDHPVVLGVQQAAAPVALPHAAAAAAAPAAAAAAAAAPALAPQPPRPSSGMTLRRMGSTTLDF